MTHRIQTGLCMISCFWLSVLPLLAEPHVVQARKAYDDKSGSGANTPPDYVYHTGFVDIRRKNFNPVFKSFFNVCLSFVLVVCYT